MPIPSTNQGPLTSLNAALLRAAGGLYPLEAGVQLLVAHGFWTQQLWEAGLIDTSVDGGATQPLYAEVHWSQAVDALGNGALAGGGSDRRILRVAASLAGGVRLDLSDAVCGLDHGNLRLVLRAIWHANGAHEHRFVTPDEQDSDIEATPCRSADAMPSRLPGQAISGQG